MISLELLIKGSRDKLISFDIKYSESQKLQPVVLFVHGFKGFKDWGHFNLIAFELVQNGYVVVKLNTSYNGVSPENLSDITDLDAFGNNNFSTELDDVGIIINFIKEHINHYGGNPATINIIGHSRGGGIALLAAKEHPEVAKVATWASVESFDYFIQAINAIQWKEQGVYYSFNGRTQQQMPLYFQLFEDYSLYKNRLDVKQAAATLHQPWLIIHGSKDESVLPITASRLHALNAHSQLVWIENANHTFGGMHPYLLGVLSQSSQQLVTATVQFLSN